MNRLFLFFNFLLFIYALPARAQTPAIDSLRQIIESGKNDIETNKALNVIATEYTRLDMNKAKYYLHVSIHLAKELKNPVTLGYAYAQMVTVQANTGRNDSALWYLQKLKELASGDVPSNVKGGYNQAAGLYYKRQGKFKEALPFMVNSLNLYIETDRNKPSITGKTSIAGQYLNIGNTQSDLGDYKSALGSHLQALKIFEDIDNKRGISFCYQSICSDFIHLRQYSQAIVYIKKSINIKNELNDKRGIASAMTQYATIYSGLQQYDKAISSLQEAIQSFRELKLVSDEAAADIELGKIFNRQNDNNQALHYFKMAQLLASQAKDSSLLLSAETEGAFVTKSNLEQKKTEEKLLGSLEMAISTGDKTKELNTYQQLADYYSKQKQFDKALGYTKKLHSSTDSVDNNELQLQMQKMEKQYNLEKKENEISLLKKDQLLSKEKLKSEQHFKYGLIVFLIMLLLIGAILLNRYRAIQKSKRALEVEKMRNKIAQDLHDDIGSMLSSINILSKTILKKPADNSEAYTTIAKIKDYSAEIMGNMSDIVWAVNPANDTMDKIIIRIKTYTAEILEPLNIRYEIKGDESLSNISLNLNCRKDFYLICKEAINNIAKYSQCSLATVSFKKSSHLLELVISDNGIGFDPKILVDGNGLKNIKARADAMNATLQMESVPKQGTTLMVKIPIT
ncbi:MAG: tetratricopeptide repeat protein [Bacteroidetes bacterium]|nr:tetratricopeptide repeat protein [Bacteroidota bacterium]